APALSNQEQPGQSDAGADDTEYDAVWNSCHHARSPPLRNVVTSRGRAVERHAKRGDRQKPKHDRGDEPFEADQDIIVGLTFRIPKSASKPPERVVQQADPDGCEHDLAERRASQHHKRGRGTIDVTAHSELRCDGEKTRQNKYETFGGVP